MTDKKYRMKAPSLKRVKVIEIGPCTVRMGAKLKWKGVLYTDERGELTVRGEEDFHDKFEVVND